MKALCKFCGSPATRQKRLFAPRCTFCYYMIGKLRPHEFLRHCLSIAEHSKSVQVKITKQRIMKWTPDEMRFYLILPPVREQIEELFKPRKRK